LNRPQKPVSIYFFGITSQQPAWPQNLLSTVSLLWMALMASRCGVVDTAQHCLHIGDHFEAASVQPGARAIQQPLFMMSERRVDVIYCNGG
jgi:hypothetical protein